MAISSLAVKPDSISSRSVGYLQMARHWRLIHDLLNGSEAMRDRRQTWLPIESGESEKNYNIRLSRSFLYNGLKNAIGRIDAKPFVRDIAVEGLPKSLTSMINNMDFEGSSATQIAKDVYTAGLRWGLCHLFIDFPVRHPDENIVDETRRAPRPTVVVIKPPQLINWKSAVRSSDGAMVLTEVVIRFVQIEAWGEHGTRRVHYIRRWTLDTWELWEGIQRDEQSNAVSDTDDTIPTDYFTRRPEEIDGDITEWQQVSSGIHDFTVDGEPAIPLVTCYFNKTGFMTADSPFKQLAEINLVHWHSFSDQRNILRFSRIAQLFASGMTKNELEELTTIAVNQIWYSKDPDSNLKYVEHSGKAIATGEVDLSRLEDRMEVLGNAPVMASTVDSTATGIVVNESRTSSDAQSWVQCDEIAMKRVFEHAVRWADKTARDFEGIDEDLINVEIADDFNIRLQGTDDMQALQMLRDRREISHETMINETKRRGVLSEDINSADEQKKIASENIPTPAEAAAASAEKIAKETPTIIPNEPDEKDPKKGAGDEK